MKKAKSEINTREIGEQEQAWLREAADFNEDDFVLHVPVHVVLGEAVDVARFVKKYWKQETDSLGHVVRRGLESVKNDRFTFSIADEILALQRAVGAAQARSLLEADSPGTSELQAAGRRLVNELYAALDWMLTSVKALEGRGKLESIVFEHSSDPKTYDALASELDDYAHLAELYREELHGLGGFQADSIEKARSLADALRHVPPLGRITSEGTRRELRIRNKLLWVLRDRVILVRAAARFVFRDRPEIIREATSAYERRRRTAAKQREEVLALQSPQAKDDEPGPESKTA